MTYDRQARLRAAALGAMAVISAATPAWAQTAPASGPLGRILDFGLELSWPSLFAAIASAAVAAVAFWLCYRVRLEGDLLSARKPVLSKVVSGGVAIFTFAVAMILLAWLSWGPPFGAGLFVLLCGFALILMAIGRATLLTILFGALLVVFVIARIYNLI